MNLETIIRRPASNARKTPLLFVHGMWHGAWCWDEFFLPYFAEHGYVSAALSLRGHAGSAGKIRGSRIEDYVCDVEQVAKTFDTPPVIIGHSMGGFVTQKYLERNNAPAGVLLGSNPHFGLWNATRLIFIHNPVILLKVIAQWRLYPAVQACPDAQWILFSKNMPEEQLKKYHARLNDESFRAYMDLLGLNLPRPKRIKTPLLILGAEDDTVIPPGDVHKTARAYGAQAEIFPSMAHDMMVEAGWKSVADRMIGWLGERDI